ncbi:MAG: AAA family ATPase [Thermoleophilia bacterium]
MLGRATETALLDDLIAGAREGRSGALVVSGEPGIGKTALLGHARGRADASGLRVLACTGSEAETHLAFAGLSDLLAPLTGLIDDLPAPQADALRGALALGPPVPGDRFTAYAGAFAVIAAAAERAPLLVLADDAHWLDGETAEALLFTARRIEVEDVAIVLGVREGTGSALEDAAGVGRLRLAGLEERAAAALLAGHAPVRPDPAVAAALVEGAAGNPLALVELAGALAPGQLTGADPLPDPLPVGAHLARGLLRPVEALPPATRRALLVAAADDGADEGRLLRALAVVGLDGADLQPAVLTGVLRPRAGGGLTFRHPLLRAAVYGDAEAPDRRAAHRAHATAASQAGAAALDREAWHSALAATGPDEHVAAALERSGGGAAARTAYAAATEALDASARLSPDPAERHRRLIAASQAAVAAGMFGRAADALDRVIGDPEATREHLAAALPARGFVEAWGGSSRRAIEMLVAAADRMEDAAPPVAAYLLAQAVLPAHMRGDLKLCRELCARAVPLAEGAADGLWVYVDAAHVATNVSSGLGGEVSAESERILTAAAAAGDPMAHIWAGQMGYVRLHVEDYAGADATYRAFIASARQGNTPSLLPLPLAELGELYIRRGRFTEALASTAEAAELAEETGQLGVRGFALGVLAHAEALLGRAEDCLVHAAAALDDIGVHEGESLRIYADAAAGLLALGTGNLETARKYLEQAREHADTAAPFNPLLVAWPQDLIETCIRMGDLPSAERHLAPLEAAAARAPAPSPKASVARCRGMLAGDDDFEALFAQALALHDAAGRPFERARTLLCLGERRRRARRARDAREALASALETFARLGAEPWVARARDELLAAGGSAGEAPAGVARLLSPRELQVALAVAEGATNREAATALLISPKTVETHLARAYEKLGVHTRAELAARMADGRVGG